MEKRKIKSLCFIMGLLLFLSFTFLAIYHINKENINESIEEEKIEDFFKEETNISSEITKEDTNTETKEYKEVNYTFVLEIPSISLKKGFFGIGVYSNTVNRNIQMLDKSNYPDEDKGNVMLAAHRGNSSISFFNKLDRMNIGDKINLYYKGIKYEYLLDNYYDIEKTGTATIKRDYSKNTITLITCKKNTKDKQVVYIGYLNNTSNY